MWITPENFITTMSLTCRDRHVYLPASVLGPDRRPKARRRDARRPMIFSYIEASGRSRPLFYGRDYSSRRRRSCGTSVRVWRLPAQPLRTLPCVPTADAGVPGDLARSPLARRPEQLPCIWPTWKRETYIHFYFHEGIHSL